MKTYWQEVKGKAMTDYYLVAEEGGKLKTVAWVLKIKDSRSTTEPFKVSFFDPEADEYVPAAAFWPWAKVKIEEGKSNGYFIDYYGDLAKAKEYAEKNYALDNSRKFVGA